jgi:hypothetical protein
MRHPTPLLLAALVLALGSRPAEAQQRNDDRWQITTDSGQYIWDIRLVKLTGDTLVYRQADTLAGVRVQQVKELRLIRKSEMRLGEGAAGAMGALTGSDDEVYDMTVLDFPARLRTVQQILLMHPVQ